MDHLLLADGGSLKAGLPQKLYEDWCVEVDERGFGPFESMERTSRGKRSQFSFSKEKLTFVNNKVETHGVCSGRQKLQHTVRTEQ